MQGGQGMRGEACHENGWALLHPPLSPREHASQEPVSVPKRGPASAWYNRQGPCMCCCHRRLRSVLGSRVPQNACPSPSLTVIFGERASADAIS